MQLKICKLYLKHDLFPDTIIWDDRVMDTLFMVFNTSSLMPLFHQRTKPRSCLGPLIVDSRWKKKVKWAGILNWYWSLGLRSDRSQEASGGPRWPQTVPDCSGTKNRVSQFSGRFEARSCHTHTDWVPGRLRPPGTKPRLSPGLLRHPEASSVFPRPMWTILVLQWD